MAALFVRSARLVCNSSALSALRVASKDSLRVSSVLALPSRTYAEQETGRP